MKILNILKNVRERERIPRLILLVFHNPESSDFGMCRMSPCRSEEWLYHRVGLNKWEISFFCWWHRRPLVGQRKCVIKVIIKEGYSDVDI